MVFGAPLVRHKTAFQKNPTLKCLAPQKPSGNERISLFFKKFDFEKTNSIVQWGPSSITCGVSHAVVAEACQEACKRSKTCAWSNSVLFAVSKMFLWKRCKNHMWQGVYLKTCISNLPKWSRNVRTSQLKAIVGYYSWAWVSIIFGQTIATLAEVTPNGAGLGSILICPGIYFVWFILKLYSIISYWISSRCHMTSPRGQ